MSGLSCQTLCFWWAVPAQILPSKWHALCLSPLVGLTGHARTETHGKTDKVCFRSGLYFRAAESTFSAYLTTFLALFYRAACKVVWMPAADVYRCSTVRCCAFGELHPPPVGLCCRGDAKSCLSGRCSFRGWSGVSPTDTLFCGSASPCVSFHSLWSS